MSDSTKKIEEIRNFIKTYIKASQQRGKMYGTISELESNWILLDNLIFILEGWQDKQQEIDFSAFLRSKGYGAKSASMVINEGNFDEPYIELNKVWNEYVGWRDNKIK